MSTNPGKGTDGAPVPNISALADLFARAQRVVFLTGAGMSTESGIPDFRSETGLYNSGWTEEVFDLGVFHERPEVFYEFARRNLNGFLAARPNPGHCAIAALERLPDRDIVVATQNIDTLHQAAGSNTVLPLHGTLETVHCLRCGAGVPAKSVWTEVAAGRIPRHDRPDCSGLLKPDIVFFGELLPEDALRQADAAIAHADLLVIAGTSLTVYPAAALPGARPRSCRLVVINRSLTPIDHEADLVFHQSAGDVLDAAVRLVP